MGYGEFVFSEQKGGLACCWSIKNPEVIQQNNLILKYRSSYYLYLKRNPISNHGLWWVISPLSDWTLVSDFRFWAQVADIWLSILKSMADFWFWTPVANFFILDPRGRVLILDPSGRSSILDPSGRFSILDPSGRSLLLDPSGQFRILDTSNRFSIQAPICIYWWASLDTILDLLLLRLVLDIFRPYYVFLCSVWCREIMSYFGDQFLISSYFKLWFSHVVSWTYLSSGQRSHCCWFFSSSS